MKASLLRVLTLAAKIGLIGLMVNSVRPAMHHNHKQASVSVRSTQAPVPAPIPPAPVELPADPSPATMAAEHLSYADEHLSYPKIEKSLRQLVAQHGRAGANTFYLSSIDKEADPESVQVYWKEDNSILILFPFVLNQDWVYFKGRTDLAKEAELMNKDEKDWVYDVLRACKAGRKLIITK